MTMMEGGGHNSFPSAEPSVKREKLGETKVKKKEGEGGRREGRGDGWMDDVRDPSSPPPFPTLALFFFFTHPLDCSEEAKIEFGT